MVVNFRLKDTLTGDMGPTKPLRGLIEPYFDKILLELHIFPELDSQNCA